jgi:hypothetical protein
LAAHEFDLKQLITWIVLSQPYSLSSQKMAANESDSPELGVAPRFSRFYLRQMRAEELYESLLVATEAHKAGAGYGEDDQERVKREWLEQFTIAFGTDEGDETTSFDGTIAQTLMLFNSDLMQRATSPARGGFLGQVAESQRSAREQIDYLFLAALARRPTRLERDAANQLLLAHGGNTTDALQDMWWAVLNSNEFILNH